MSGRGTTAALDCVIAGGATGGHLFPGVAIAEEWVRRQPGGRVWFISIGNTLETRVLAGAGFALKRISAAGLKGRGLWRQGLAAARLPLALIQGLWHLWRIKPAIVIGMGSYASGPVLVAARMLGIATAIHEQNRRPGWTNRILAPWMDRIFVSFADTALKADPARIRLTGNPIRRDLTIAGRQTAPSATAAARPFAVAVIGGSQGARSLNEAVIAALPHLRPLDRFALIHQSGPADRDRVKAACDAAGITARVAPFFDDMAAVYSAADLVVCRAGASTVAEITVMGKPVVFVPFPYAADNHQELNARALEAIGAADLVLDADLSGPVLARKIMDWAGQPEQLAAMGEKAARLGCPDAAARIVDECLHLVEPQGQRFHQM